MAGIVISGYGGIDATGGSIAGITGTGIIIVTSYGASSATSAIALNGFAGSAGIAVITGISGIGYATAAVSVSGAGWRA